MLKLRIRRIIANPEGTSKATNLTDKDPIRVDSSDS